MSTQLITRRGTICATRLVAAAFLGCTLAVSHAMAQVRAPAQPPQSRELQQLDQLSRTRIQAIMQSAARAARVAIEPRTFVYASRDDVLLVNAGILGSDSLDVAPLDRGVNVMFVYLRLPPQSRIPAGFYTVRVSGRPGAARAALLTADGRVAAELPATVREKERGLDAAFRWRASGSVTEGGCMVDWHGRKRDIVITVTWE